MKYEVLRPEVYTTEVLIEADSPEQAIEAVMVGEGEDVDGSFEYAYTREEFIEYLVRDEESGYWLSVKESY